MAGSALPGSAPDLDRSRLLGSWYVLVTNHGFWKARTHPRIEHDALATGGSQRVRSSLRFRQIDMLGREQQRVISGVEAIDEQGVRTWRGEGVLRLVECRWSVPIVDPDHRWVVAWFDRTNLGMAAGLAIHTKDPWLPAATVDTIVAKVEAHPFLGGVDARGRRRCEGLRATKQHWVPPEPYRLK